MVVMASCSTGSSPGWPSDWLDEPSPAPWTSCHGGRWTKSARHLRDTSATSAHKRQALSQGRHAFAHAQSGHVMEASSLVAGWHMGEVSLGWGVFLTQTMMLISGFVV